MDSHDMWFLTCVPNFSSLAWLEVCQEPPVLKVILEGCGWFPNRYLEDGVILNIMDSHDMRFLTCVPNFSSLAWIEMCQELPILEVILGGHWWFLTGDLEDEVLFDFMNHLNKWLSGCLPSFRIIPWKQVQQEPPSKQIFTWGGFI